MPDKDVNIKIITTKDGSGAQEAKQEIDSLVDSTNKHSRASENASLSNHQLGMRLHGVALAVTGVRSLVSGAADAVSGLTTVIGGLLRAFGASGWGRLIIVFASLIAGAIKLFEVFRGGEKDTKAVEAQAKLAADAFEKISQTNLENLTKSIADLNTALAQTLSASDAAFESLKAMREAELAGETAKINKAVAYGEITPEEGERRKLILTRETKTGLRESEAATLKKQQAEIEATDRKNREQLQALTSEKERRGKFYSSSERAALTAGVATPDEVTTGNFEEAQKRAEAALKKAESKLFWNQAAAEPGLSFYETLYNNPLVPKKLYSPQADRQAQAEVERPQQEAIAKAQKDLILLQNLQRQAQLKKVADEKFKTATPQLEQEIAANDALFRKKQTRLNVLPLEQKATDEEFRGALQSVNTKETQRKKTEELALQREVLEREYQKAEEARNVAKAGQLSKAIAAVKVQEYENSIMGTKVEPAMQAARKKNIVEQQAVAFERFTNEQDKKSLEKRADLALDQQRAEEQAARIQLQAAEKVAGDKKLPPRQRAQAKQDLSLAQSRFGKESADVSQAEAIVGKIRETVDPAALANLIRSIESLGANVTQALNQAAAAVNNVNSQVSQQSSQIKNGGLRTK
ncbi:MAG: hypothetical protein PHW60_01135 [Kiritimatiellae bacterium]|nr:hypothetical protein [Kiritimatiellia bacterium]